MTGDVLTIGVEKTNHATPGPSKMLSMHLYKSVYYVVGISI